MSSPLISVIISTFNRAHIIGGTLDSILAQTYTNWECIIVDDGSTDGTMNFIEKYVIQDSRFKVFERPNNRKKGPNSCRNFGFENSNGEYVNWLDSDDLYFFNSLEIFADTIDNGIDAVVCKVVITDLESGLVIKENKVLSDKVIEDYFTGKITYYVSGPIWSRAYLMKQDTLFDENITNLDDWDFNLRMLYNNPHIKFINKPLINYRSHCKSLSKELIKLNINEISSEFFARDKHLLLLKNNNEINWFAINMFILERYKFFYKTAMINHNGKKIYFFIMVLKKQVKVLAFKEMTVTVFGFIFFNIFKRGYRFL
jgi:glycosyltransferase involved in cell wall biosynthesis